MKIITFSLLCCLGLIFASTFSGTPEKASTRLNHEYKTLIAPTPVFEKLNKIAGDAKKYIRQKQFNDRICFFIDMSLPSGQKRFFIYDLRGDSILNKGLVAHGNCFQYWLEGRRYSNIIGSGCTSLGKYKVGNPYTGRFGYSYKLHGLDSSNSNAYERTVVLHPYSDVPENETEDDICQSNGCPMVSPTFMEQLRQVIENSKKPLLMWIYD